MKEMNEQELKSKKLTELNGKLLLFVGFRKPTPKIPISKLDEFERDLYESTWIYPDGTNSIGNKGTPFFPESLDACFKWLKPEITKREYRLESYTTADDTAWWIKRGADEVVAFSCQPESALALCLAIEKLIDRKD